MSDEDRVPETLWHVTDPANVESILERGLDSPFGNYFCEDMNTALKFTTLRYLGETEYKVAAIEVLVTDDLKVHRSYDHSYTFFQTDDSWVIMEPVSPENIVNVLELTITRGG